MTKIVQSKMKAMRRWNNQIWTHMDYSQKKYPPGQHGKTIPYRFVAGYCSDLRMIQSVKKSYLASKTFMKNACRMFKENRKKVNFSDAFTAFFELMAMKVIFNAGFVPSIFAAKQLVSHAHFMVNGEKFNLGRMRLSPGDVISVRPKSLHNKTIVASVERAAQASKSNLPQYLGIDYSSLSIKILRLPTAEEINLGFEIDFNILASFY
jgi:small subunit ribosomal protein S4